MATEPDAPVVTKETPPFSTMTGVERNKTQHSEVDIESKASSSCPKETLPLFTMPSIESNTTEHSEVDKESKAYPLGDKFASSLIQNAIVKSSDGFNDGYKINSRDTMQDSERLAKHSEVDMKSKASSSGPKETVPIFTMRDIESNITEHLEVDKQIKAPLFAPNIMQGFESLDVLNKKSAAIAKRKVSFETVESEDGEHHSSSLGHVLGLGIIKTSGGIDKLSKNVSSKSVQRSGSDNSGNDGSVDNDVNRPSYLENDSIHNYEECGGKKSFEMSSHETKKVNDKKNEGIIGFTSSLIVRLENQGRKLREAIDRDFFFEGKEEHTSVVSTDFMMIKLADTFQHAEIIKKWIQVIRMNENEDDAAQEEIVIIPSTVFVTEEFDQSLKIFSDFINREEINLMLVDKVVTEVANIPHLMMFISLIEDNEEREKIMNYPIIKRVMLCKYSILRSTELGKASWLSLLLQTRKPSLQKKVVDYLERISNMSTENIGFMTGGLAKNIKFSGINQQTKASIEGKLAIPYQKGIAKALRDETNLMPSMLLLKTDDLERVSKTHIVKTALDLYLCHPFGVAIVVFDIMARITLLLRMRYEVFKALEENYFEQPPPKFSLEEQYWRNAVGIHFFALTALGYIIFRRIANAIFLFSLSSSVYFFRLVSISELVEIISIFLTIVSYGMRYHQVLQGLVFNEHMMHTFAFTIGFLWLSLIIQFKILNPKLATFVNSIGETVKEIAMFLVLVVGTVVWAFGDMLFIMIKGDEGACPNVSETLASVPGAHGFSQIVRDYFTNPFCVNRGQSYLAAYRVFIGDFSVVDFDSTKLTTFLFVVLTFLAVVILINVLIALVIESHESSQKRIEGLFGNTRVHYVAKMIGFEIFLHPLTSAYSEKYWRKGIKAITWIVGIIMLLCSIPYGLYIGYYFQGKGTNKHLSRFLAILIVIILDLIIITMFSFVYTGWREPGGIYARREVPWLRKIQNNVILKYFFALPIMVIERGVIGKLSLFKDESKEVSVGGSNRMNNGDGKLFSERCMGDSLASIETLLGKNVTEMNELKEKMDSNMKYDNQEHANNTDDMSVQLGIVLNTVKGDIENMETSIRTEIGAIKQDIMTVKKDMKIMEQNIKADMNTMKQDMKIMEQNIKADMNTMKQDMMIMEQNIIKAMMNMKGTNTAHMDCGDNTSIIEES